MSKSKAIIGSTAIQVFGRVVLAGISIIILKLLTNYLNVGGYGNYGAIYEYLALFSIFADFGLYTISIREMSEQDNPAGLQKVYGNLLSLRVVLVIISMTIAIGTAFFIPEYNQTPMFIGIIFASIFVFFALVQGAVSSILQYNLKMYGSTIGIILGKIFTFTWILGTILFIPKGTSLGFYSLIIAGCVGAFLTFLITVYYAKQFIEVKLRFDFDYWKELLKKAAPYGFAVALGTIYFKIDVTLMRVLRGEMETGIYLVPMRILEVLNVVPLYFMNSAMPTMTKLFKSKQEDINRIMQYCFDLLTMVSIPILIGGFILSWPITSIISSKEYLSNPMTGFLGSDVALKYLLFAMVISYIGTLFTFSLVAIGQHKKLLWVNLSAVIFNLTANIIIIPIYGFVGATITSICSALLALILSYLILKKYKSFNIQFDVFFKILLSASAMGLAIYFLEPFFGRFGNVGIITLITLGAIFYALTLYLSQVLKKSTFHLPNVDIVGNSDITNI